MTAEQVDSACIITLTQQVKVKVLEQGARNGRLATALNQMASQSAFFSQDFDENPEKQMKLSRSCEKKADYWI